MLKLVPTSQGRTQSEPVYPRTTAFSLSEGDITPRTGNNRPGNTDILIQHPITTQKSEYPTQ